MINKTIIILFLVSIATIMILGLTERTTFAIEKVTKKSQDTCITSKCHATMKEVKYVHGPVVADECTICHGELPQHAANPKKHTFGKIDNVQSKCFKCHDQFPQKKLTHTPVAEGECIACHSPHGSPFKFQLVTKAEELCFECHDKEIVAGKFVHGPAAVGGCVACHDPHTADFEKNMRAKGPDLCFMCHVDKAEAIHNSEYVHEPVLKECISCHNPHSAEKEFMLKSQVPDLCLDCHEEKQKQLAAATVKHGALDTEKSCLNCHDAHSSNIAKNLLMEPLDLCMSCHDKEYERSDGKSIINMKKLLADNTDHHGPIKQKDCSGCHDPHGSKNFRILRNPYPETFYKSFSTENYNLCFSCHEKTLVLNAKTTKLTNFRNGNVNLHFKHVNKPKKGRTCRACHETHASNFPKHIRKAVPFGAWELPLNFEKTETGGSCTPGCHKIKKYDRVKMEING